MSPIRAADPFDLDVGRRADDVETLTAQLPGGLDMRRIADRLVFSPDPGMVGDHGAATEDPDAPQVRGHLDASPDRDRMHRVVVSIAAHVVIPRQPARMPPPEARRHWWQHQHRGLIRLDPIRRATPSTRCWR